MNGLPGRTICVSIRPTSASAFCWLSAPASVIGAIAPASVNGVTHTIWLRRDISMIPWLIGTSSVSGELVLMIVKMLGSRSICSSVTPAGDPHHLDRVDVALPAERVDVDRLVGEREEVVGGLEVADRAVDVDRLDRVTGRQVDRVQGLREAEQVPEVVSIAGPAATVEVGDVRCAAHRTERQEVTARSRGRVPGCGRAA